MEQSTALQPNRPFSPEDVQRIHRAEQAHTGLGIMARALKRFYTELVSGDDGVIAPVATTLTVSLLTQMLDRDSW